MLADLLRQKNLLDSKISAITGRPASQGHTGEFIASVVFDVELHQSATFAGSDGVFASGPLVGKSVNIKWYGRNEYVLDIATKHVPDYFLVLCGPTGSVASRGGIRPWVIDSVHLFHAADLIAELAVRGVKIGIATSVVKEAWRRAEIFPAASTRYVLNDRQRAMIEPFSSRGV